MIAAIPCAECARFADYVNLYRCPIHGTWSRGGMILRRFNRASTWRRYERAGSVVLAKTMPDVKRTQTAWGMT